MKKFIPIAIALLLALGLPSCASGPEKTPAKIRPKTPPPADGPSRIELVTKPLAFQDQQEPFMTEKIFEFDLPRPPRRARLKLRYSGVPGNQNPDYLQGKFRDKVELNDRYLMDLNTHSEGEERVVEYTKWISVGMFHRHNKLKFSAGHNENREARPDHDEFELRHAVLEFDW